VKVTDQKSADWKALESLANTFEIEAGIFAEEGAEAKEGSPGATLIQIANIHELGLGVPQRSFIRGWFEENKDRVSELFAKQLDKLGVSRVETVLERLALWVQADIQLRITRRIPPPLADATIKRKKSSVPLVDTGQLKGSILAKVNGKMPPGMKKGEVSPKGSGNSAKKGTPKGRRV